MTEDESIPNVHTDDPEDSEQEPAPADPATPDVVGNTHIDEGAPF